MDLSFPAGKSVNDMINPSKYLGKASQLKYPSVDDLVELVKNKGKGCALMSVIYQKLLGSFAWILGTI